MTMAPKEIEARDVSSPETFMRTVSAPCLPVVIRGLVGSWPVVLAAKRSPEHFREYVSRFDTGTEAEVFVGAPEIAGKYLYSEDLSGFNFVRSRMSITKALDRILSTMGVAGEQSIYMGSLPVDQHLPGFDAENRLPGLKLGVAPRIWLGHASNVSAHYDTLDNLACVTAGRRRFTLFPPETTGQLYMGPIDHTLAGQPISLAASAPADNEKYPLFREAREKALVAELEPGDAIYIPKLWWHQVEAVSPFNVLLNYWWDAFSSGPDAPAMGLLLSMIMLAERPPLERQAWKVFFDHFVFRTNGHPLAHLPESQRGVLGPLTPDNYKKIRARVMHVLLGGK